MAMIYDIFPDNKLYPYPIPYRISGRSDLVFIFVSTVTAISERFSISVRFRMAGPFFPHSIDDF